MIETLIIIGILAFILYTGLYKKIIGFIAQYIVYHPIYWIIEQLGEIAFDLKRFTKKIPRLPKIQDDEIL